MRSNSSLLWFFIYVVFGAYLINLSLNFYDIPKTITDFNKWFLLVGGVLVLIGGVNHLRVCSKRDLNTRR